MNQNIPAEYLNQIIVGDACELTKRIPDKSIDLILTDPIYDQQSLYDWLATVARRILRPHGVVLVWSNGHWHRQNTNWLEASGLYYRWDFAVVSGDKNLPMDGHVMAGCNRVIWLDRGGDSKMIGYLRDGYQSIGVNALPGHERNSVRGWSWGKSLAFTRRAVLAFTDPGAIVFDPFAGEGTHPAVCKALGRHFIAFEIDPVIASRAHERVVLTQPMHSVFLGVQEKLAL